MELYETNYILFRRLCPELDRLTPSAVSIAEGALDLHLRIVERSRYTTTVKLTYHFENDKGRSIPEPDLRLRIYHDARQVEVLRSSARRSIDSSGIEAPLDESELAAKWKLNRFLYKWLRYCLYQKHRFAENGRDLNPRPGPALATE